MAAFFEEIENRIKNSKGGTYFKSSLSYNLDLFSLNGRNTPEQEIEELVANAYSEDKEMLFKNILNILDIRGGKGERHIFKACFKKLIELDKEAGLKVLDLIGYLGRWDYILVGIDTQIEKEVLDLINKQIYKDIKSDNPSLLAKWLPSVNTSSYKTKDLAKRLVQKLEISEEAKYRRVLSNLRKKIKIVENNLREKDYTFEYKSVPGKALMKYNKAFIRNDEERFNKFGKDLESGKTTANAKVLTPGEIVAKIHEFDISLINGLWKNLKQIDVPENVRVMPVIDVSGSMGSIGDRDKSSPINQSIGLGMYFAERGVGEFKDKFITFSSRPQFVKLDENETPYWRLKSISKADWGYNTDINRVFNLILMASKNTSKDEVPTHIVIISDMEFDRAENNETNFELWRSNFSIEGLKLPKIIFWNVAGRTGGFPVVKNTADVSMISGFSTNVIENLFSLEELTPINQMVKTLSKYDIYL